MIELAREFTIIIVTHNMQQAARVVGPHGVLHRAGRRDHRQPHRSAGRVRQDREDLLQPARQAHRGLHLGPLRLSAASVGTSDGGGSSPATSSLRRGSRSDVADPKCPPRAPDNPGGRPRGRCKTPRGWPRRTATAGQGGARPGHRSAAGRASTSGCARAGAILPGRLDAVALLEVLCEQEPLLPVIVGIGAADGPLAARIAPLEPAAVVQHPYRPSSCCGSCSPSLRPAVISPSPRCRSISADCGFYASAPSIELDGVRIMLPRREYLLLRFLAERVGRWSPARKSGRRSGGQPTTERPAPSPSPTS